MTEKPPFNERLALAARGIRWCNSCRRYTNGTYVHAPGQPGHGNLCGPGCFKNCEDLTGRLEPGSGPDAPPASDEDDFVPLRRHKDW